VEALRLRRNLLNDELKVAGEASPDFVEWLDLKGGEILCVLAV
jgi:hypothetical protein